MTVLMVLLCTVITSCTSINYFGENYPATKQVKMFYRAEDIPKNVYISMGRGTVNINPIYATGITEDIRKKAMSCGADAALIIGFIEVKTINCEHCGHDHGVNHELRFEFFKKKPVKQN